MSNQYYNNHDYNNSNNNSHTGYHQQGQGQGHDYYNQHPQHNQQTQPYYSESVMPPADAGAGTDQRGLLGAIGGGLSGGILGKQTNHGFLGTVGGALVGSLTEDFIKKRHSRPSSPQPAPVAVTQTTTHAGYTPMTTPMSPPVYPSNAAPTYGSTTTATTSYFQPPCVGTAHPCPNNVHHCMPPQNHDHHGGYNHGHHGGHGWHK